MLNSRQLATILHALRIIQCEGRIEGCNAADCEHFADAEPLTNDEIDDLCESLNCGDHDDQPTDDAVSLLCEALPHVEDHLDAQLAPDMQGPKTRKATKSLAKRMRAMIEGQPKTAAATIDITQAKEFETILSEARTHIDGCIAALDSILGPPADQPNGALIFPGTETAKELCSHLITASMYFELTPLPDDYFEVRVRDSERPRLAIFAPKPQREEGTSQSIQRLLRNQPSDPAHSLLCPNSANNHSHCPHFGPGHACCYCGRIPLSHLPLAARFIAPNMGLSVKPKNEGD